MWYEILGYFKFPKAMFLIFKKSTLKIIINIQCLYIIFKNKKMIYKIQNISNFYIL
jgi:hypothetical protein